MILKGFLLSTLAGLSFLASSLAFAFGGGGGSSSSSQRYNTGVDSFGAHFGGEGQVQIQFNCVPDEQATSDYGLCTCLTENAEFDYTSGKCTCKTGWTQKGTQCEFACTEIENCTEYNDDCTCKTCADISYPDDQGGCTACPNGALWTGEGTECYPCPKGEFQNWKGGCISCSATDGYLYVPLSECTNTCANTEYPRKSIDYYGENLCVLETCPEGYFRDKYGYCLACSTTKTSYDADADECSTACANSGYPRIMIGDCCALETCPEGHFRDIDGSCYPCFKAEVVYNTDATRCTNACNTSDSPYWRYPTGLSGCKLCQVGDQCTCPEGQTYQGNGQCG